MATETIKNKPREDGDRESGIPGPHQLGDARKEGLYIVLALVVFAIIAASFWFEATR